MKRSGAAPSITSRLPEPSGPDWHSVFESAAVGIAITDLRGRYLASNRAHQKMLGYTGREMREKTFLDVTHEDDRPATLELGAQMARGDLSELRLEKRYRRKDGKVIWVRVTASTIPGPTGAPSMLMAIIEDITDRKRAEDQVRLSEAYMADAQRISRTGSWVLEPYTGSLFWSKEVYHILGYDPADGPPTYEMIMDRIHPDDVHRVEADVRRALRDKTDYEGEHRLLRPDGTVIHVHYIGHPVVGIGGEVVKCIGTIADITPLKLAEEERNASLALARGLAVRLMKAQDDERRRIARQLHETAAQDLAALKMNLAALSRRRSSGANQDPALIEESAALAARAMEEIRVLSYLLHPPLLDEAGLGSALRWYVKGFGQRSGIELRLAVAEDFGRLPQDIETTLFRSVQESLINIHRHAKSATAEIRLRREPSGVVLEVQDWGRGLPPEIGPSGADGDSLGVGIAAMRERVQQLGGRLELESGASGTTVRIILPLPPEVA